jgi:TolB-like protein
MSDSSNQAVFLSYASQDAEAARRICEALRAAGVEVWFDQSGLRGGDAWDAKIRRQIKECALFIPIISANSQTRLEGYFRREWRVAVDRMLDMDDALPFLLPVVVDDTPDAEARVPDPFRERQWTRLPAGEGQAAFAGRVRTLLLGARSGAPPAALGPPPLARKAAPGAPGGPGAPAADPKSVAVLAFANRSNDPDNEYFSDGISEELINELARIPGLKVTARTSAFHFKGKDTPIAEIARQLGVAYVVEGSVRKSGERVRILAQLIKAADGFQVWSENFDRELRDIFAVQDEIAGLIARNLSLTLGSSSPARVADPEAYRRFLQGRAIFNREVPGEFGEAVACYQASLALDPTSALTWAWLSLVYGVSAGSGTHDVETGNALAREAAARAITLDPNLAKGHAALGLVQLVYDWDWKAAANSLDRASALAPGDVETVCFQSHAAMILGQAERAVLLGRRALELDPLNTLAGYALLRGLLVAGRFEEMGQLAEHVIALNPSGFRSRLFLSLAHLLQGRADEAARTAEQVPMAWARLTTLAMARFAQGRPEESEAVLQQLQTGHGDRAVYQMAQVHAFRGERDAAFEWLETAYRARDSGTVLVKGDPLLRSLRDDPRWLPFLRKVKLADDPRP